MIQTVKHALFLPANWVKILFEHFWSASIGDIFLTIGMYTQSRRGVEL